MMPACTGLPPGELMRSTTACAPASSNALFSAATRFSALASASAAISPRTSISAVCGPLGAVTRAALRQRCRRRSTRPAAARRGGRRCASGARCGGRAGSRARTVSSALSHGARAAARGRRRRAQAAVEASRARCRQMRAVRRRAFMASRSCVVKSANAGRVSREGYQYTWPSRSSTSIAVSRPRPHGPPTQRPLRRLVGGAVDRAEDESRAAVEELAGLPVHLGRHVHAAVQVGDDPAVEAQREGARRLAEVQHVEHAARCRVSAARRTAHSAAAAGGGDRQAWRRSQSCSSAVECATCSGANVGERVVLVRAVADADARACRRWPRAAGRAWCRRSSACARGSTPNSRISSSSIRGSGLEAVSSAVRVRVEQPLQLRRCRSASSSPRRDLPVATPSQWWRAFSACSIASVPSNSTSSCWRAK